MSATHTPLPWHQDPDAPRDILAANGELIATCYPMSIGVGFDASEATGKANAELVLRACTVHQDLLTALCDLQTVPGCWCSTGDGNPHTPACLSTANVIARIEGCV